MSIISALKKPRIALIVALVIGLVVSVVSKPLEVRADGRSGQNPDGRQGQNIVTLDWDLPDDVSEEGASSYVSLIYRIREAVGHTWRDGESTLETTDDVTSTLQVNVRAGNAVLQVFFRSQNMYLLGFRTGGGTLWDFPQANLAQRLNVPAGTVRQLPFGENYNSLEGAGKGDRHQVYNQQNIYQRFTGLLYYSGDRASSVATALIGVIAVLSEAARFVPVFNHMSDAFRGRVDGPLSDRDLEIQTKWNKITKYAKDKADNPNTPDLRVGTGDGPQQSYVFNSVSAAMAILALMLSRYAGSRLHGNDAAIGGCCGPGGDPDPGGDPGSPEVPNPGHDAPDKRNTGPLKDTSNKCLDLANGELHGEIIFYQCNGGTNQKWKYPVHGQKGAIESELHPNWCVVEPGGVDPLKPPALRLLPCDSSETLRWEARSDDTFRTDAGAGEVCLDHAQFSDYDRALVYRCHGSWNQRFSSRIHDEL